MRKTRKALNLPRSILGTGGNGQVWLADEHLPDGSSRPVAIKVLHDHIAQNPTRVECFRSETEQGSIHLHPHFFLFSRRN